MGILADLFIADLHSAKNYNSSILEDRVAHLEKYKPVELRGLTDLEFSTLWALLENEEWDINKHQLENIEFYDEGESWLFFFPQRFCKLLARLTPPDIQTHSASWANTEELEMSGWKTSDTELVISSLVKLVNEAVAKNYNLYLWGSV